jgi:hypothetical protein
MSTFSENYNNIKVNQDFLFLIVCDRKYLKYAKALIQSILCNTENHKVHLTLYSERPIDFHFDPRVKVHRVLPPPMKTNEELRNFYVMSRASVILELLKGQSRNVLYLDADSIVRNDDFGHLMSSSKVKSLMRETDNPENKFLNSTIFFPNSFESVTFCQEWKRELDHYLFGPWYSDQTSFYYTYLRFPNFVQDIGDKYCDIHDNNHSTIWCGKGNKKEEFLRTRYAREFIFYRLIMYLSQAFPNLLISKRLRTSSIAWIHFPFDLMFAVLKNIKRFLFNGQQRG